jgi:hypothetical protein
MSRKLRRFEILLPLKFNDGRPIPDELIGQTLRELRVQFGASSWETQLIRGSSQHEGHVYSDELVRVFVDVPNTKPNVAYFIQLKARLKDRFEQLDIWMTSHPIDLI